jgi:RNA polymerase sigma-70 factor (ECF subfamily)
LRALSYTTDTDEGLVQAIAGGNTRAFNELYRRYGQKMFSYFYRMLWQDAALAEDCVQELFLKLIRYAGRFNSNYSFQTWLYSIAHNMCKNEYRRYENRQQYKPPPVNEAVAPATERQLDLKRFRREVDSCLSELDEEKRTLFVLRFEEQLSVPDISRILELPEGTVKSRLFYLLKHLSGQLKNFESLHLT